MKTRNTTTLRLRNLTSRSLLRAFFLFPFVLACFALTPQVRALCQEFCNDTLANTFLGTSAGVNNTTGNNNTAVGFFALNFNSTGYNNTANGFYALVDNATGFSNTANGVQALSSNTTGSYNTAIGVQALALNSTGYNNTANGVQALSGNTTGSYNTAIGFAALVLNDAGSANTATGQYALYSNEIGNYNTATGQGSLLSNTGSNNTAYGNNALFYSTTGGSNIALGDSAGINLTTGSNNIDIGNKGKAAESQYIRIGTKGTHTHTFIAGVSGVTVGGGVGVIIDTNGKLGTVVSSERFKDDVKPMDKTSEAILALKPVTFRYKHELDTDGIPQFGLIAEQVEKVNPDLVVRDEQGKPYSVRYEAVNAMLLNEFLKEHRKVEDLKKDFQASVAQQQKEIASLAATLKEQAAQIQKVSAQLEAGKLALQVVNNP
jgi:endosialidase-like protein